MSSPISTSASSAATLAGPAPGNAAMGEMSAG
jgi:hypothetical protein